MTTTSLVWLHNSLAHETKPPWHSAICNTCQFICMHIRISLVFHHQLNLQRVKTILGISRSGMQQPNAGSTIKGRIRLKAVCPCMCKLQFALAQFTNVHTCKWIGTYGWHNTPYVTNSNDVSHYCSSWRKVDSTSWRRNVSCLPNVRCTVLSHSFAKTVDCGCTVYIQWHIKTCPGNFCTYSIDTDGWLTHHKTTQGSLHFCLCYVWH